MARLFARTYYEIERKQHVQLRKGLRQALEGCDHGLACNWLMVHTFFVEAVAINSNTQCLNPIL